VRHARDLDAVRSVVDTAFADDDSNAYEIIYMEADICRSDLLVEIELLTHYAGHAA
jgi:chorismate lyase / 3-hydroxybenzoate synthase